MKRLKIGFSKPRGKWFPVFSWAIRLYERVPFSHVYLRWDTQFGVPICYQASGAAINFMGDYAFKRHLEIVEEYEFDVPDKQWAVGMKFCLENVGKDYALMGVLGVPLMDLFKLSKNPFSDGEESQYCAELVTRFLAHLDIDLKLDADRVKLKQVHEFIRQLAEIRGKSEILDSR